MHSVNTDIKQFSSYQLNDLEKRLLNDFQHGVGKAKNCPGIKPGAGNTRVFREGKVGAVDQRHCIEQKKGRLIGHKVKV